MANFLKKTAPSQYADEEAGWAARRRRDSPRTAPAPFVSGLPGTRTARRRRVFRDSPRGGSHEYRRYSALTHIELICDRSSGIAHGQRDGRANKRLSNLRQSQCRLGRDGSSRTVYGRACRLQMPTLRIRKRCSLIRLRFWGKSKKQGQWGTEEFIKHSRAVSEMRARPSQVQILSRMGLRKCNNHHLHKHREERVQHAAVHPLALGQCR